MRLATRVHQIAQLLEIYMATYTVKRGTIQGSASIKPLDPKTGYSVKVIKHLARTRRARVFTISRQVNAEIAGTKRALCNMY